MYTGEFVTGCGYRAASAKCKSLRNLRRLARDLKVLSLLYLSALEA
jgi:hypothetical protein